MNVTIRVAIADDAVMITELSEQLGYTVAVQDTYTFLENITDCDAVFVAVENEIVIGWMQLSYLVRLESGFFCEIVGLVVEEQRRGKGIGKMLIDKAKEWCRGRGCKRLKVRSNVKRQETHLFYLNTGFTEVKEQKVFEMAL